MGRVLLIDGSNYLHRGHWAIVGQSGKKEPLTTSDGFATSGIKGMLGIIIADIHVLRPDAIVVCYDSKGAPNWRTLEYPMYKKGPGRVAAKLKAKETGNNVYEQLKPVQRILRAMGIKQIGVLGEEADDIIGTLAVKFSGEGHEVLIGSTDKDFGSLVNRKIKIVESTTRRILGVKAIEEKFGVKPSKMVEFLMLQGDKVDNIPGVAKCAGGTASKWLNTYGDIKTLLANIENLTPVLKANLKVARKHFKMTRRLITLRTTIEHDLTIENCGFAKPKYRLLERLCSELEMIQTHSKIVNVLERIHQWS